MKEYTDDLITDLPDHPGHVETNRAHFRGELAPCYWM